MDHNPATVEYATVVSVEVRPSGVGDEPLSTAVLRDDAGRLHSVSILAGPNSHGGFTKLSGFVVPFVGDRVRLDLHEEPPAPIANAWTAMGPKWGTFPVAFALALPGSRDVGLEAGNELDIAGRSWSTVKCTAFRASFSGTTTNMPSMDGVNGVYFEDAMWPTGLTPKGVAQTVVHFDTNNVITDADIHVNGADYKFSLQGGGAIPDVRAILTHEMGHALGLGHSSVMNATMFATYPGGLSWRSLEADDHDGVCSLYPGTGAPGCDTIPCPGGFVCVANQCERKGALGEVCSPCTPQPGSCLGAGDDARCVTLANGGHVCGRACMIDAECGNGFHCKSTTTSGDFQCISDDNCASAANACAKDTDCTVANTACKMGACVDVSIPGSDAGADASSDGGKSGGQMAGCSCNAAPRAGDGAWSAVLFAIVLGRRRFSRRR
jgi:hypothetical protein